MHIRDLTPSDKDAVRTVITAAFDQPDEAGLVDQLRAESSMRIELVAETENGITGHVAMSAMTAPEGWLAIAPVSVIPAAQGQGIGSALVRTALERAHTPVVVLGAPDYYGRLGFDYARASDLTSPFPIEYTGIYERNPSDRKPNETLIYAPAFGA